MSHISALRFLTGSFKNLTLKITFEFVQIMWFITSLICRKGFICSLIVADSSPIDTLISIFFLSSFFHVFQCAIRWASLRMYWDIFVYFKYTFFWTSSLLDFEFHLSDWYIRNSIRWRPQAVHPRYYQTRSRFYKFLSLRQQQILCEMSFSHGWKQVKPF